MSKSMTNGGGIEVESLSYQYPGQIGALDGVSFIVPPGERVGLIGPNGAGKSTLLLCLLGLADGFSGRVVVGGIEVGGGSDLTELRRRAGLVFQDTDDQLFNPTVIEDVAFGPRNLGKGREEAIEAARMSLESVGLPEDLHQRPPHKLSGGQKRRAAIAGILAMEPSVILLDEPTSDLDPRGVRRLSRLLNSLPQTMVVATHNLEFVLLCCHRAVVMDAGKVVADGAPKEVMDDREFMEAHGLEKPHSLIPHSLEPHKHNGQP